MSSFQKPIYISDVFNASLYDFDESNTLTIYDADRRYLKLSGGIVNGSTTFNSGLIITGNSSLAGNLTFSGSSIISGLTLITSTSIIGTTLTLGGSSISNTQINYLTSITPGTASASKALVLDASSNINNIGSIGQTIAAGGDMLVLTSSATTARNTIKFVTDNQSWEIGSRGSTASNPTNFYVYNGAYKLLMNPTGDTSILSSTDSSSASTGCLKLSGGLGVVKNMYCTGILTLDRNGSNLSIVNGSNTALIELPASPNMLRLSRGFVINIGTSGVNIESGSTRDPRCAIDLGQTASNKHIALYDSITSWYGFSANNTNVQYSSGGGHAFYGGCTSASPQNTLLMNIDSNGNSTTLNNVISKAAFFSGINNTGLSGQGLKLHYSGSLGQIFSYDYTNSVYKDIQIGGPSGPYTNCSSGFTGIGATGSISFPFVVLNSISSSITGGYGYLNSGGAGSGSNTGSVAVSAYFGERVFAKEVDCFSDERLKHMIQPIDGEKALNFIREVTPIEYEWKSDDAGKRTGYSAQQLLKTGLFPDLVTLHLNDKMVSKTDSDGFVSPDGYHFAVQYSNAVAILHKAIQEILKIIEK